MDTLVDIVFTPHAEALLQGETGIHRYTFATGEQPNIGDSIALRSSPSGAVQTFVCTARLWDFSRTGERRLQLTLDFPLE